MHDYKISKPEISCHESNKISTIQNG
jgi:hypothetical protein